MFEQQIEEHARTLSWTVIEMKQTHPGGDGYVPHGVALVKRPAGAWEGREYATVNWYIQPRFGPGFESGHYDLTLEDAAKDYGRRSG